MPCSIISIKDGATLSTKTVEFEAIITVVEIVLPEVVIPPLYKFIFVAPLGVTGVVSVKFIVLLEKLYVEMDLKMLLLNTNKKLVLTPVTLLEYIIRLLFDIEAVNIQSIFLSQRLFCLDYILGLKESKITENVSLVEAWKILETPTPV